MKKITFLLTGVLVILQFYNTYSQDKKESLVNDGIYVRETIPQRTPVPYPLLRESDMMWTKRIWRYVDLQEKMNHPLYYPTKPIQDRVSLLQRLVSAIKYNEITAYDPLDDEFTTLLSYDQVIKKLDADDKIIKEVSMTTGRDTVRTQKGEINWTEIKGIILKEEWFFDKQHSTLQVRIIGICPIRQYYKSVNTGNVDDSTATGELLKTPLFWVYFPEARKILANTAVFNNYNDAQRISFDDLFFKRRFSSYIMRESNVYDNRQINEYIMGGVPIMQESERIKYDLFSLEHDLWEY